MKKAQNSLFFSLFVFSFFNRAPEKMAEKRPAPPLLSLSRLKAPAATRGGGDNINSSSSSSIRVTTTSSSSAATTTLFDARRELAADLQRREARRAQARAEALDTEGEAAVLAALRSVHRLLREAGEERRRKRVAGIRERGAIRFSRFASHLSQEAIRMRKRRERRLQGHLFGIESHGGREML